MRTECVSGSLVLIVDLENQEVPEELHSTPGDDHDLSTTIDESDPFVTVALKSSQCFAFDHVTSDSRSKRARNLLVYELEDLIPCDADDLSIGRVDSKDGQLIVATDSSRLINLISECSLQGIYVRAITPLLLLALGDLKRQEKLNSVDLLVWSSDNGIDLIWLCEGIPSRWNWIANDDFESVSDGISGLLEDLDRVSVMLIGAEELVASPDNDRVTISRLEIDQVDAAAKEANRISDGTSLPMVDLRDGPLAPSQPWQPIARGLRFAAVALLAFQISLVAALLVRRSQYQGMADEASAESVESYRRVFPNSVIPVGIAARLESERRKLLGTRGVSEKLIPRLKSVAPVAHAFLSSLPSRDEARYEFDRIEMLPGEISLATGTARAFSDQELIGKRLRVAGLVVPPMSAEIQSDGVSLRLENVGLLGSSSGGDK